MDSGLLDGRWFQQILDAMTEHIAVIDSKGWILMVNQAWRRFARDNGNPDLLCHENNYLEVCRRSAGASGEDGRQAQIVMRGLKAVLSGRLSQFRWEYSCHSPREQRWFVMCATPLIDSAGGAVITHVNITDSKLREEESLRQAHQDTLTGLANRRLVEKQALQIFSLARRNGRPVTVLALDLDEFKPVNDSYGHAAAPLLIRGVRSRRRKGSARPPSTQPSHMVPGARFEDDQVPCLSRNRDQGILSG